MKKIPTLFVRDPQDMSRVLRDVHPACRWVVEGEGVATRKYDGTCVRLSGRWWARREVKPGKSAPPNYVPVELDTATGKMVGWEPMEQSAFGKYANEAIAALRALGHITPGTYELCGPKVNGNPEKYPRHVLIRHAAAEQLVVPRDYDRLRAWMAATEFEGVVWHHPDGRMAKLKRRDFPEGGGRPWLSDR